MLKPNTKDILQTSLNALNNGDPTTASSLALQVLQKQPENRDALMILGAARLASLANPHDVFFSKLKSLGFSPQIAVDIGAYEGQWTKSLKRSFPETKVIMIEAQPAKAGVLEEVVEIFSNVTLVTRLVGDRTDESVTFHIMETPYGSTGSFIYPEQTSFARYAVNLPMETLDNILTNLKIVNPDLLKIDVQGAELDILHGATNTLRSVEFIHMELSTLQYNAGAPLIANVLPKLDEIGFVLFDILEEHRATNNILFQLDALFINKDSLIRPKGILL